MIINYIPFRPISEGKVTPTTARVDGEVLILNGQAVDLSMIPDNTMLPLTAIDNTLFGGPIIRRNGKIELTLKLAVDADAPDYMWANGQIEVQMGDVPFPVTSNTRESEWDIAPVMPSSSDAIDMHSPEEKIDV
ncbi:hypothetical protein BK648_03650 [Pseudomonas poae]|uniref:Uncharacterized protein n=1 Tax=Pseudomonas poae TaxID=200451 RepID=A0A423FIM8_9PSED|nr:hypothetical protein [Pseudomonas poae]ROM57868.1 hypothetical protein BK648_03650 [Pseudomonas poae]